jgi:hypothetical protein
MPIPVQRFIESQHHDRNRAAIVTALEQGIHRLLDGLRGTALTRLEIGEAFKAGAVGVAGLKVEDNTRELFLAFAQLLSPQIRQTVKDGSDALDEALTNLVRRGDVRMTLLDLQAHFWTPTEASHRDSLI